MNYRSQRDRYEVVALLLCLALKDQRFVPKEPFDFSDLDEDHQLMIQAADEAINRAVRSVLRDNPNLGRTTAEHTLIARWMKKGVNSDTITSESAPRYLASSVVNELLNKLRKETRRQHTLLDEVEDLKSVNDEAMNDAMKAALLIAHVQQNRSEIELFCRLQSGKRSGETAVRNCRIFFLAMIDRESENDIRKLYGLTPEAYRQAVHRARVMLRAYFRTRQPMLVECFFGEQQNDNADPRRAS